MKSNETSVKLLKNSLMFLGIAVIFLAAISAVSATSTDSSSSSSTIYVNGSNGNDDNDGTSWEWAKKTISNATKTVTSGGTIYIANGNYNEHEIQVNKNMTIVGESRKDTVVDAHGINRVFTNNDANKNYYITLINLTIQNGNNKPTFDGGAIHVYNGNTFSVINCTFKNNTAKDGGAIINHGTLILSGCTFTGNTATNNGGAVYSDGTLTVTNCIFTGNNATTMGGAIYNANILSVTNSTFTGNTVTDGSAGAIFNGGNLAVNDCDFISNTVSRSGGAIWGNGGLTIINSAFANNTAGYDGGAIYTNSGTLDITNSKFVNNTAHGLGGAIVSCTSLTASKCTFTGNRAVGYTTGTKYGYGGALYLQRTASISSSRIAGNSAVAGDAIYSDGATVTAKMNWWGSNNPNFPKLISGNVNHTQWLYMTINADPKTIKNGETSQVTVDFNNYSSDGVTYTSFNPLKIYIPDGTPVTFNTDKGSIGSKTIDKETSGGTATATLTADETAGIVHLSAVTDDQTVNTEVTITAVSSLNLTVKTNNTNLVVGDTVLYTLKVSNSGPDAAKDVVMTYVIPEGLEFAGAKVDVGNYTYDPATRTITWTIDEVPVGDPYMWLSLRVAQTGEYSINPILSTSTYDPTINSAVQSLTVSAAAQSNTNTNNTTSNVTNVNAASKTTIGMQKTGLPLNYLILAILIVIGGLVPRRK